MDVKGFYRVYYSLVDDNGGIVADTVVRYVAVGYGNTSQPATDPYDINKDNAVNIFDVMAIVLKVQEQNS